MANMAEGLVFYLFREFAAIYSLHRTLLQNITARFEKYGHLFIVCLIIDVILRWSSKSALACQILHRTHCAPVAPIGLAEVGTYPVGSWWSV